MRTKILLCDRDITFLGITRIKLQQQGYEVETVNDCDYLVSTAGEYRPAAICVDIGFNSAGCEVMIVILKNNPATCDIPVLVFSTRASDKDAAIKAGAFAFLSKPFEVSELEAALRDIKRQSGE
jgi:DNA-binding response OmpR family regulator